MRHAQGYCSEQEGQISALGYNGKPLEGFVPENNTILPPFKKVTLAALWQMGCEGTRREEKHITTVQARDDAGQD